MLELGLGAGEDPGSEKGTGKSLGAWGGQSAQTSGHPAGYPCCVRGRETGLGGRGQGARSRGG